MIIGLSESPIQGVSLIDGTITSPMGIKISNAQLTSSKTIIKTLQDPVTLRKKIVS